MNIVLTGFMASGKSVIARSISDRSVYKFIDTDEMIVDMAGKSIQRIFDEDGEPAFRRLEREVICRAAQLDGYVIATGGGVPLNPENIKELRKNGVIVNLSPSFETVVKRLDRARSTRPLLQNRSIDEIKKRFDDRQPFYADCDIRIDVTNEMPPGYYADRILDTIGKKYEGELINEDHK